MLGSVRMTEEEEEVGGRTTSSYTAMFAVWRGLLNIKELQWIKDNPKKEHLSIKGKSTCPNSYYTSTF